ncbi:MAG: flagellar hook-associated protein 3 FlgL [Microbacteriaceae bacterium]|nr:flagellar hook-associated protein 3 FlgL [Microbacteriaceae bacterium]
MFTRVTNQSMVASAQRNLQASMSQLAKLQQQASSQQAITRPSDDPIGTSNSIAVRSAQRANTQYGRNINDGNTWLTTIDSALSKTSDIMNRVRDLTVQGANDGSLSAASKEAIATELDGLKQELLSQANTTVQGRTVFAGNSNAGVAFQPDYTFTGTSTGVERRVGSDQAVRVDADGSAVFGAGSTSVFALIDTISSDLRSGTNVSSQLQAIDSRMSAIRTQWADVGGRQAQIQSSQETNMQQTTALEAQRSGIEDVDLGKTILDLQMQNLSYQSALGVTAKVLQPTLMDFLK